MKIRLFIVTAVLLAGCATQYQQKSFIGGGFSETQLAPNLFQVSFSGNGYTSEERASDFTLLRSAELALQNGFRYFIIIDAKSWQKTTVITTPVTAQTTVNTNTTGTLNSFGNYGSYNGSTTGTATTQISGGESYVISKPQRSNTIVCFAEHPQDVAFAYDAQFIQQSLRAKYKM